MIEFTVFYIIFSFCFVFPPSAFVSAGFTVANLLDSWLGSEDVQFLAYQLRRSVATIVIHSLLPFGYFIGLALIHSFQEVIVILQNPLLQIIWCLSVLLPSWASFKVGSWWQSNWETHPLVASLKKYANNGATWTSVASEINAEFRRTNQISKVVITNSWIIKVEPYNVHVAHQNHVILLLENAEEHNFTVGSQTVQFLSVRVEHVQTKELLFTIRINAIDYADMQDRLQSPINNFRGVTIHQDVHARFSKVFIEEVQQNPVLQTQEEMDSCLGCAINIANVRLVKRCDSSSGCTPCFCRPMWCIFCLSKWFSARQDKDHPETWLSSRCPCPTCRSPFCMLDVSLVEKTDSD